MRTNPKNLQGSNIFAASDEIPLLVVWYFVFSVSLIANEIDFVWIGILGLAQRFLRLSLPPKTKIEPINSRITWSVSQKNNFVLLC